MWLIKMFYKQFLLLKLQIASSEPQLLSARDASLFSEV